MLALEELSSLCNFFFFSFPSYHFNICPHKTPNEHCICILIYPCNTHKWNKKKFLKSPVLLSIFFLIFPFPFYHFFPCSLILDVFSIRPQTNFVFCILIYPCNAHKRNLNKLDETPIKNMYCRQPWYWKSKQ